MESVMETTTITADLTTCKIHMNGVVSTPGARLVGGDVKYFYLNTPLKKNRYGKVRAKYIPEEKTRNISYNNTLKTTDGFNFKQEKGCMVSQKRED